MNLEILPRSLRAHMYLFWAGMVVAGLGVIGFFLSFGEVASPANAWIDVHSKIPVLAYTSIFAWLIGLIAMWYSRRKIDAAVRAKLADDAPGGREE